MSPTIVPNCNPGLTLLAVSWCNEPYGSSQWESPILAWSLAPGADPVPIALLELDGLAWCIWDKATETGFVPWDHVLDSRAEALAELTSQAQRAAR